MLELEHQPREHRQEVTQGLRDAVGIRHGKQVKNHDSDQHLVIFLLNKIQAASGGTLHTSGPTRFKTPREGHCAADLADAIKRFQEVNNLPADRVVDPNGPTLNALFLLANGKPLPAKGRRLSGRVLAELDVPLAVQKVERALEKLRLFRLAIVRPTLGPRVFDKVTEDALFVHFRLTPFGSGLVAPKRAVKLADVDHLITHFDKIKAMLLRRDFSDGSPKDKFGNVVPAAANLDSGKAIFSSLFRNFDAKDGQRIGDNSRAAILIHEGMHAVDAAKVSGRDDIHISEFSPAYDTQSPDRSLFNPSSFAGFAAHVFLGKDPKPRFGLDPKGRFL
jgi:hypothetical protein